MATVTGEAVRIDAVDAPLAAGRRWRIGGGGYAQGKVGGKVAFLHRLIADAAGIQPLGVSEVDHINRDKLDCRRANLRPATHAENMRNRRSWGRSGFRGVEQRGARFLAVIVTDGRKRRLGIFPTAEQAARAYDAAAVSEHGEFAALNFPTLDGAA